MIDPEIPVEPGVYRKAHQYTHSVSDAIICHAPPVHIASAPNMAYQINQEKFQCGRTTHKRAVGQGGFDGIAARKVVMDGVPDGLACGPRYSRLVPSAEVDILALETRHDGGLLLEVGRGDLLSKGRIRV